MPMYQKLHSAIREYDEEHIILFEPTTIITSVRGQIHREEEGGRKGLGGGGGGGGATERERERRGRRVVYMCIFMNIINYFTLVVYDLFCNLTAAIEEFFWEWSHFRTRWTKLQ